MYRGVREQIPEFLSNQIVFCDNLIQQKSRKSCLILTRNLKFYEFEQKQLLRTIDLSGSCLNKVADRVRTFDGPKGKWFANGDGQSDKQRTPSLPDICFGKYVRQQFARSELYLLIRCWSCLVVLQRLPDGFKVVAEYKEILHFMLVHGKIKFEVLVELEFQNGQIVRTNFCDVDNGKQATDDESKIDRNEFKEMLNRVERAQAELQIQKSETARDFERLRNVQAFGENFVRSMKLSEKQMLARCGDIWIRFSPDDALVIGVQLVNNCIAPNLRTLKNLKPIIQTDAAVKGIKIEYCLYQLKQNFEDVDRIESFFQSEDVDARSRPMTWMDSDDNHLPPDTYATLLIKFHLSDVIHLRQCPLFVLFEISTDFGYWQKNPTVYDYELQIFIKNLDFQNFIKHRQMYEIDFKSNNIHQDFLTIAFTSLKIKLCIKFHSTNDMQIFEDLLEFKFDFQKVQRPNIKENRLSVTHSAMDIDSEENAVENPTKNFEHILFYNSKPTSMFHGMMAMRQMSENRRDRDDLKTYWNFYVKNEQKGCLLIKMLFDDLLLASCNVEKVEYLEDGSRPEDSINFENALREELKLLGELIAVKKEGGDFSKKLHQYIKCQLRTDVLASSTEGAEGESH